MFFYHRWREEAPNSHFFLIFRTSAFRFVSSGLTSEQKLTGESVKEHSFRSAHTNVRVCQRCSENINFSYAKFSKSPNFFNVYFYIIYTPGSDARKRYAEQIINVETCKLLLCSNLCATLVVSFLARRAVELRNSLFDT